jgi:predicted TIM-barrel enzyme
MRTTLLSLVTLGLLAACAEVHTVPTASGDVLRMDQDSITLDSGGTFVVPEDKRYMLNEVNPDDGITVIYEERDGQKVVQEIVGAE